MRRFKFWSLFHIKWQLVLITPLRLDRIPARRHTDDTREPQWWPVSPLSSSQQDCIIFTGQSKITSTLTVLNDYMVGCFVHLLTFLEQLNDQYLALLHSQAADGWMIGRVQEVARLASSPVQCHPTEINLQSFRTTVQDMRLNLRNTVWFLTKII